MPNRQDMAGLFKGFLEERILVFDGAMGTAIQDKALTAADFGGPELEGCNENLVRTRPDIVRDIHRSYLEAGADILETNSFGGTAIVLAEYGLEDCVLELNQEAARLARQVADSCSTRPRFVAGAMGPTTKAITVTGGVTFEQLSEAFHDQAAGLLAGGVDFLFFETVQDTRNIKAGLIGIHRLFEELGYGVPIMVSGTIEGNGTMLAGQGIEAFATSLMHVDLLAIGLNCATGPEFMTDHIRSLAALTDRPVSCIPNAGLPDEEGRYLESPESLAASIERFVDRGWINLLGGCCGTTPAHIRAIVEMVKDKRPRVPNELRRTLFSGIDFVEAIEDQRPLIVGERTNEVGSRQFKRLVTEEKYEEASEIGRQQVKGGAHIIDVNLQNADRDELKDIERFYEKLIHKIKVPIMIDTTDPNAIEKALIYCQGKCIINSINLEDGLEKFERVTPLARKYGAALIVGCIDEDKEQAQAITRTRKLEIAKRSYRLLTAKYGIPPQDIIFDPLVFPCGTGDQNYIGSAFETIEGLRLIKKDLPDTKTVLGISNISFGLPAGGREMLNSVFLYHATKAGLDLAIVNSERLKRYASIPEEERRLAEDLLYNRGVDPIAAFAAYFRKAAPRVRRAGKDLPLEKRLANYIIEGSKTGLIKDLELKLQEASPLDIINGPLMAGMQEVGRLFNNNELIVAEVLQSAEAMKASVSFLEMFMEKSETSARGKIILATVKGDVHDIGKNLVEIILSNNGYNVINLGIKVPPEVLIQAAHDHRPDVIGLSGLLVKSAQQMAITADDLKQAGISLPLIVGGAALSNRFARTKIAPVYGGTVVHAKDAMKGLDVINRLMDPESRAKLEAKLTEGDLRMAEPGTIPGEPLETENRSGTIALDIPIPEVPDLDRHALELEALDEIWSYINPKMLYGRHMGLRGNIHELLETGDKRAIELHKNIEKVKADCRTDPMHVRAVYQFFEAEPEGNCIHLYERRGAALPLQTFRFPRQRKKDGLCLSDLVLPPIRDGRGGDTRRDHIALFVTTAGEGIRERAEEAKQRGEYFRSHALQALAIETAEAAAEWLHAKLREAWAFPDPEGFSRRNLFQARYRGKRYSFGYAACPEMVYQEDLFRLLRPEEIGVRLTEGFMMDPEASVSALVFHHPDASYFSVHP